MRIFLNIMKIFFSRKAFFQLNNGTAYWKVRKTFPIKTNLHDNMLIFKFLQTICILYHNNEKNCIVRFTIACNEDTTTIHFGL